MAKQIQTVKSDETIAGVLLTVRGYERIERQIRRLSKRAGVPVLVHDERSMHPAFTELGPQGKRIEDLYEELVRVELGEFPRQNGHRLVATIEHTEVGNLVCAVPGSDVVLPRSMRDAAPTCDHCSAKRTRRETYVVQTPEGDLVRVGKNCLADFLCGSAAELRAMAEFVRLMTSAADDDEQYMGGKCEGWGLSTARYVACAVACVERYGFHKSREDGSTAAEAQCLAFPPGFGASDQVRQDWQEAQPTVDHYETARQAIAWAAAQTTTENDYLYNLSVAARLRSVGKRGYGLLASLPTAYAKAMGESASQAKFSDAHWGTVGERASAEVVFCRVNHFETDYGVKWVCTFRVLETGERLVWKTTSASAPGMRSLHHTMKITARVQDHSHYRGNAQTVVSRVKWEPLSWLSA